MYHFPLLLLPKFRIGYQIHIPSLYNQFTLLKNNVVPLFPNCPEYTNYFHTLLLSPISLPCPANKFFLHSSNHHPWNPNKLSTLFYIVIGYLSFLLRKFFILMIIYHSNYIHILWVSIIPIHSVYTRTTIIL